MLRFAEGGWKKGRDLGFAFALRRGSPRYYLWIRKSADAEYGHPLCEGVLQDQQGRDISSDSIGSFALADFDGDGSIYLAALTDTGRSLSTWNLASCEHETALRAVAQKAFPHQPLTNGAALSFLISGDFLGEGRDIIQAIEPTTATLLQWTWSPGGLTLVRHVALHVKPGSSQKISGIKYVVSTRLPHEEDNVAFEAATLILHSEGYSLVQNNKTLYFAPNCRVVPRNCVGKTLIFHLDQGFTGGIQDIAHHHPTRALAILDRVVSLLVTAQKKYNVLVLINPIHQDRKATLLILDRLSAARIPFILDYYSSDVTNLAYIKKNLLDYEPRAFDPLKGLALDPNGLASSPESVAFFDARYGAEFAGLRIMERFDIDLRTKLNTLSPLIPRSDSAYQHLVFDWQVATDILKWATARHKLIIWADPGLYLPYECYWTKSTVEAARIERDAYINGQQRLAKQFDSLVPMYDNNEGLKRCGVAFGTHFQTPRNFRLRHWERIPAWIAQVKQGNEPLAGPRGYGVSVQSWSSDYDPILTSGTLPAAEIVIWTLDAFSKGASVVEFEPYFYFFRWHSVSDADESTLASGDLKVGEAGAPLKALFSALNIQ